MVGELSLEGRTRPAKGVLSMTLSRYDDDYADVRGQELAKRALVIAAAGAHNLLMLGPPGSGKTVYMPRHRTVDPATRLGVDVHFPTQERAEWAHYAQRGFGDRFRNYPLVNSFRYYVDALSNRAVLECDGGEGVAPMRK